MASKTEPVKHGKAYTPPKGHATVHNTGVAPRSRVTPMMEWIIAGIIFVIVLGAIFYFGSDFRSGGTGGGGGGHSGAGLPTAVDALSLL